MEERMSSDVYFMGIAVMASMRSACPRRKVGAVLVKDKRIISTGYSGAPAGFQHCFGEGCMFEGHCINTIHAEVNCLTRAKEQGDTLYSTDTPCINCFKACLSHNPGMRMVWLREYRDEMRAQFIRKHINSSNNVLFKLEQLCESDILRLQEMIKY